jgi:putative aldouronate transport system permease protein
MLLPVMVYYFIFKYWPMAWLSVSLYDFRLLKGFGGSKFVGLKNYIDFLQSPDFGKVVCNTVLLNLYQLVFVFISPILFALLLNEIKILKYKKLIQTISYLPYFISTVVLVSTITTFLSPSVGLLNGLIKMAGWETIYFLGDPSYFRPVYIISSIWQSTGWSAVVYLSAFTTIDPVLYEAAITDGAGRFRQLWHITLPGILTAIIIQFLVQLGNILNVSFEKAYLLQNSLNLSVSEVLSTYVYKQGIVFSNISYGTTVGMFNSIISLVLVLVANALSKKVSEISLW